MIKKYILSLLIVLSACSFISAQELETIYLKDGSILKGVMVEQEPGKMVLFSGDLVKISHGLRMVSEDVYEIPWGDISYIEKDDRSVLLLSGTDSRVTLKNGKSYEGLVKEIHPGQFLKLKNESDKTYEFNYSDIKTIETIGINEKQSLIEQLYHKDMIILKNGKTVVGFIAKQNIGKTLSVILDDGTDFEIELTDIYRMKKSANENYNPIYDVVLQPGQFVHDKVDIEFQNIKPTQANIYIVNTEAKVIDASVGQKVNIHANLVDKEAKISAVKAVRITEKASLVGNKENHYETFRMEDFANSNIVIEKSEVSKVGTTEFSFIPSETGYYVLQVSNINGFIIVRVS